MDIWQALILGIVQGITEWLPISSSGHLVIVQSLFGLLQPVAFDLALHLGSLLVVLLVFWKDITELVVGVFRWQREKLLLLLFLIIGTIPIAIIGYFFNDWVTQAFSDVRVVGFGLLFTAVLLFFSRYPLKKEKKLSWGRAAIIGLFQGVAILPGVSRSGSTIASGMFLGVKKEEVARFSFLLFIPAILGATVLQMHHLAELENLPAVGLGVLASVVVGWLSLRLLLYIIKKDNFFWFSAYCAVVGLLVLGFSLF